MTAVCVLGPPRSGTSAVAHLVQELGAPFGPQDRLKPPTDYNPEGLWEHADLSSITQAVVRVLGGSQTVAPRFAPGWDMSPEIEHLKRVAAEVLKRDFAASDIWAWKIPLACLALPFWQQVVPEMRYVICVRNPLDVAASIEKVWNIPFHEGIDIWLQRHMSVLLHTSGRPRAFFSYDDYFRDPEIGVKRLADLIGEATPAGGSGGWSKLVGTLRGELRTFSSSADRVLSDDRLVDGEKYFYLALRAACGGATADTLSDLAMFVEHYRSALWERHRACNALVGIPGGSLAGVGKSR